MSTRLSVNVNKIALIRNARGSNFPDLSKICKDIESYGAEGITVHPRPDERHITYADIPVLKSLCVKPNLILRAIPTNENLWTWCWTTARINVL